MFSTPDARTAHIGPCHSRSGLVLDRGGFLTALVRCPGPWKCTFSFKTTDLRAKRPSLGRTPQSITSPIATYDMYKRSIDSIPEHIMCGLRYLTVASRMPIIVEKKNIRCTAHTINVSDKTPHTKFTKVSFISTGPDCQRAASTSRGTRPSDTSANSSPLTRSGETPQSVDYGACRLVTEHIVT